MLEANGLEHRNVHDWATPIHGTWSGELLQHLSLLLEVVQPQHGEMFSRSAGMRRKVVRVYGRPSDSRMVLEEGL